MFINFYLHRRYFKIILTITILELKNDGTTIVGRTCFFQFSSSQILPYTRLLWSSLERHFCWGSSNILFTLKCKTKICLFQGCQPDSVLISCCLTAAKFINILYLWISNLESIMVSEVKLKKLSRGPYWKCSNIWSACVNFLKPINPSIRLNYLMIVHLVHVFLSGRGCSLILIENQASLISLSINLFK